ncbi:hypothetical protein ACFRKD_26815 [Streptomyces niveus]|uniref:hypothetical protein n=1 Tax=Streptomyces niveus TaxID=193462 RepID=UPI0036B6699F
MTEWTVVVANVIVIASVVGAVRAFARYELGAAAARFLGGWAAAAMVYLGPDLLLGDDPAPSTAEQQDGGGGEFLLWTLLAIVAVTAVGAAVVAVAAPVRRRRRRALARREQTAADLSRRSAIEADHDRVREEYGRYVADALAFVDRPALGDVTVPTTAAFLHAMYTAADVRRGEDLAAYREAVSILKTAWRAADDHARKTGIRHLPAQERATISKARALLELALDGAGSDHERHAAYAKARALLDGILVLPRQATAELESRHRLSITNRPAGQGS